jgi:hypothetical protein
MLRKKRCLVALCDCDDENFRMHLAAKKKAHLYETGGREFEVTSY